MQTCSTNYQFENDLTEASSTVVRKLVANNGGNKNNDQSLYYIYEVLDMFLII